MKFGLVRKQSNANQARNEKLRIKKEKGSTVEGNERERERERERQREREREATKKDKQMQTDKREVRQTHKRRKLLTIPIGLLISFLPTGRCNTPVRNIITTYPHCMIS
jgi:hypothetical protein